ncbi:MAG: family 20 glycosylhydrolase, partial [Puniceicoccales bacterium]|nr:family 20 glycosylhydrolase [Puniceicoccales bacterium]
SIPAVSITDAPRFQWRGVLLDVARHFFTKEQIFRLLDRMAVHKLNSLQIHFTDDQAWRLEIKRFPKLTTVGAVGDIDNRNAPARFFTQDDVREIIAYAKKLHIRIVPEIEMPAHSGAAIRSYPEIACDPKKHGGGGMICPVNEKALRFYEGVLDEVCELFDSPFIHIGGDECNKSEWRKCPACNAEMKRNGWRSFNRLQSAYIAHVDKYLAAKKRRLLGWDEILEGGLAPGATVMSWRGAYHKMSAAQGGLAAAKQGRDIIFSPCDYLYLDYQQFPAVKGRSPDGRRYFGFPISVRRIFNYEPTDGIPPELRKHLLGIQANMWTEVCPNEEDLEWKLFPRLCAVAEIAWTPLPPAPAAPAASALPAAKKDANAKKDKKPADRRDYADFVRRLEGDGTGVGAAAGHLDRLRRLGIRHAPLEWKK